MMEGQHHPLIQPLRLIFEELGSSNPAVVKSAVARLHTLVEEEGESLFHRSNAVNIQTKVLFKLIESHVQLLLSKPETRLGGIYAIEELCNVDFVDVSLRLQVFSDSLTKNITDPSLPSTEAARVWGLMMDVGGGIAADLIDQQLAKCMGVGGLYGENLAPNKRYVGCLLLQEVAPRASASTVLSKFDDIMRGLWGVLKDNQDYVRNAAAAALRKTLDVVMHSADPAAAEVWFDNILTAVAKVITQKQRELVHGGLLAFHAWLAASVHAQRSNLVNPQKLREIYLLIVQLLQKPSNFAEIRAETVACAPLMAQYDKQRFVELCLNEFVIWAGTCYRNISGPDERSSMFISIGQLAGVLQDKVPIFIDRVMAFIEGSLVKKGKRERCPEAVSCFAMIAAADAKTTRSYIRAILPSLFACTPSVAFAKDIASICKSFPELRSQCMEKLLDVTRAQFLLVKPRTSLVAASDEDTQVLLNGLEVLHSLDFSGYSVLPFLTDIVCRFVQDTHEGVRRASISLCLKLVHSGCSAPGSPCMRDTQGTMIHQGRNHIRLIQQVMRAVLNSAVADPESDIRLSTLEQLVEEYDHTLALQDSIRALFPALNDKHQNRLATVNLLGRLARSNPACVYPMLRRVLLQCITEIQYFNNLKKQEQSTWVLAAIVEAVPVMVRPYVSSLLLASVDRLKDKQLPTIVQTALLCCVGRLVRFTDEVDLGLVRDIRSIVVSHVMDSSSSTKKQEAIRALGEIVRATRDTCIYDQHPDLLRVLLSALHGGFKETWPIRQDVLRLMGIIGAVDPVKVKGFSRPETSNRSNPNESASSLMRFRTDEAAAHIVIRAIMEVIELPSTHDEQCVQAIQALVNICTSREMQLPSLISFLPKIVPAIIHHIQSQRKLREKLFRHLTTLIVVAKHHIRAHLEDILDTVQRFIPGDDPEVLSQLLVLLSELRRALNEEFKPHLRVILPLLVLAAHEDTTRSAEKIFECFISFGKLMDGHLHIVLPCIVEIASSVGVPHATRMSAIAAITFFAKHLTSISDHAARCVHCLCRVLQETVRVQTNAEKEDREQLSVAAWTALLAISQNLGPGFAKFSPIVRPIVSVRFGENNSRFMAFRNITEEAIRSRMRVINPEPPRPVDDSRFNVPPSVRRRDEQSQARFATIRNVLLPVERTGEDEWKQWLRQFAIELLRSSPCQAHGYALPLAQIHEPFARQLFYPAFAACYSEMDESTRQEVVALLTNVLRSPRLPSEVLQELLNLSEFMERCDSSSCSPTIQAVRSSNTSTPSGSSNTQSGSRTTGGLFDIGILIERSDKCSLHAKALHYLEVQFTELTREYERGLMRGHVAPVSEENWAKLLSTAERSIYLNNLLGQRESADGILKYIQDNFSRLTGAKDCEEGSGFTVMDAELLEKLQWWSQSLKAYQERLKAEPNQVTNMRGVMTAMDAQGEYSRLLEAYKVFSRRISKKEASTLAPMGARAAWILQSWDDMEQMTQLIPEEGYNGTIATFYRAVIAVHKREFRQAQELVNTCRRDLDGALSALVAESYDRAYNLFVGNQQLCELEEIMLAIKEPATLNRWKELWERRLTNMAYEGWQGTLATHSLVLPHTQELPMWIQFASLCRSNGRERVSTEVLNKLLNGRKVAEAITQNDNIKPLVALAALTHMYEVGKQPQALALLKTYVENVEITSSPSPSRTGAAPAGVAVAAEDIAHYAMCRAKLGEWTASLNATDLGFNHALTDDVLKNLQRATELDHTNGATWHIWARIHHDIAVRLQNRFGSLDHHVTCALDGYLRSIGIDRHLQDVLGFLSLWFAYGSGPGVEESGVLKAMLQLNANVWLRVIPQIIARIYTSNHALNEQVHALLSSIAKVHPQALLYTLNVSSGGATTTAGQASQDVTERRRAAQRVLARISELHHNGSQLTAEASMVCQELVRCAVLWTELWYDELDRAWFCWGREKDANQVWLIIEPLLSLMAKPETMAEHHFVTEFGPHLEAAANMIRDVASMGTAAHNNGGRARDMEEAWNNFKSIVERIDQQINSMSSLAMQLVSPKLLQSGRNLLLAVPGQYREVGDYPRIAGFHPTLKVMSSKQHPRRVSISGSDGNTYKFLLKGHEDLRLDERVMQLLGLVNTLLSTSSTTNSTDCFVQTYSVTPLSDNAGLVGWVDHCDTLHQIIKDHRVHGKQLSAELNLMRAFCDDLTRLTVLQHVEPFEYALENTDGNDLARSLWIRAPSAETWLDRRTTYVRTLATMSMVGHILGLGDRHPSNLMIHSFSGRVIHIDFGDCFEVAQQRSAFPEKVPFRLTRMFVKAMEIGDIEGLFRHGCVSVMSVLREERNSLLAMLEAFLHDPLISWWRDESEDAETPNPQTSTPATKQANAAMPAQSLQRYGQRDGLDVGSLSSVTERSMRRRPIASVAIGNDRAHTKKAQKVLNRIKEKLNGKEYHALDAQRCTSPADGSVKRIGLPVEEQVSRLIEEAMSNENLCQHFPGWCPFW